MLRGKKIKGEESNLEKKSHQDNSIDRITTNICAFQLNIEKNSLSREHFFYLKLVHHIQFEPCMYYPDGSLTDLSS